MSWSEQNVIWHVRMVHEAIPWIQYTTLAKTEVHALGRFSCLFPKTKKRNTAPKPPLSLPRSTFSQGGEAVNLLRSLINCDTTFNSTRPSLKTCHQELHCYGACFQDQCHENHEHVEGCGFDNNKFWNWTFRVQIHARKPSWWTPSRRNGPKSPPPQNAPLSSILSGLPVIKNQVIPRAASTLAKYVQQWIWNSQSSIAKQLRLRRWPKT